MRLTQILLSRYLKRYIERELTHSSLRRQWKPILGWKEVVKKTWVYNEHRPWTDEFKAANPPSKRQIQVFVEPIKEWKIFNGDRVEILVGKDKGKQGLINCIIKERNWVFVEGLNCEYSMKSQGGIMPVCTKDEKPLMVTTQVKLVDPGDSKPTEVEWRFTETGERVRVSVRSGRILPLPSGAKELEDRVNPLTYTESQKDTKEDELTKVTFQPKLSTFEQDINDSLNIRDDRKPIKTYWY